ncbi:hypothetical protein [Rubricoccus marinus]|uniref:Outer membrane protein beta-barrel domain-containing protein n=1 Tax=Rubricoccus marinus TaxID=716817 RepID=A0A259TYS1_9BACT|nr:hypothetical protein [Rubricoccus marinus]OZC02840.1 hypothetical protein BSZ36_07545 [Rubricoccus marinus]
MRRLSLVFLLAVSHVAAQTAPETRSTVAPEAKPWRVAASGGIAGPWLNAAVSLSAERTVRGPVAVGGRLARFAESDVGIDDGGSMTGGSGEVFASLATRGSGLGLRALAGLGVAVLDYDGGGFGCFPEFGDVCSPSSSFSGARPYAVVGLGLDYYPQRSVGIGAEGRAALMDGPANVSSFEVGLRVRL